MSEAKVDRRLDLIGKVCPYPTLETKLTLKTMTADEVLEIISDYYPARQTIPDLVRALGYKCELIDGRKPVFHLVIKKT